MGLKTLASANLAAGICIVCGCHPPTVANDESPTTALSPQAAANDPETMFRDLEQRLVEEPLRLRFDVTAEGAVEVDIEGSLIVEDEVELRAKGTFAGQPLDLRLWSEGDHLQGGPVGNPSFELPRPMALAPALVLGLTRMGVLHNIAMLMGGAPPDHSGGGVEAWVQTVEHRSPGGSDPGVEFGLVVDGTPSGSATLWLDAVGQPRLREQRVDFPEGTMIVVERYEDLGGAGE